MLYSCHHTVFLSLFFTTLCSHADHLREVSNLVKLATGTVDQSVLPVLLLLMAIGSIYGSKKGCGGKDIHQNSQSENCYHALEEVLDARISLARNEIVKLK